MSGYKGAQRTLNSVTRKGIAFSRRLTAYELNAILVRLELRHASDLRLRKLYTNLPACLIFLSIQLRVHMRIRFWALIP